MSDSGGVCMECGKFVTQCRCEAGCHDRLVTELECERADLRTVLARKGALLRELVELVESDPALTAEKWVEKLNQLSKQAKREIGDE